MTIINLRGGLGNQMFQVAIGELLKKEYGLNIKYSKFFIKREENYNNHIDSLKNINCSKLQYASRFEECILAYSYKLIEKISSVLQLSINSKLFVVSSEVYKYIPLKDMERCIYIDAYFQNFNYFRNLDDELRDKLKISDVYVPNKQNQEMLCNILNSNAVCVHIRRGDYTSSKWAKTLMVCDKDYYEKGIQELRKKVKNPVFFIFSNSHQDLEWIRENYNFNGCMVVYVDLGNKDYQELFLMSKCKHFVLSNSSFSWWACYLSDNNDKKVIAPKVWTKSGENYEGVYGDNWMLM